MCQWPHLMVYFALVVYPMWKVGAQLTLLMVMQPPGCGLVLCYWFGSPMNLLSLIFNPDVSLVKLHWKPFGSFNY
jgi:ABC-type enterochelin transport system permease subunit